MKRTALCIGKRSECLANGHFGKSFRNTLEVLEGGAGWGWRRSVRPIASKEKSIARAMEERYILHTIKRRRLSGLVRSCVGTAFWNTLLKEM